MAKTTKRVSRSATRPASCTNPFDQPDDGDPIHDPSAIKFGIILGRQSAIASDTTESAEPKVLLVHSLRGPRQPQLPASVVVASRPRTAEGRQAHAKHKITDRRAPSGAIDNPCSTVCDPAQRVRSWHEREAALRKRKGLPVGSPFWRHNLFRLCRELKADGATALTAVECPAGAAACREFGESPPSLFAALRDGMKRVRTESRTDAMARAFALAVRDSAAFAVPECLPFYGTLAALAFHLTRRAKPPGWSPFPSARIAAMFGVPWRQTIDQAVGDLADLGVIEVLKDQKTGRTIFSRAKRQARQVRYTGPIPETFDVPPAS